MPRLAVQPAQGSGGTTRLIVRRLPTNPLVRSRLRQRGMTLLELFVVMVVAGLLASIAVPTYQRAVLKTKVSIAVSDILRISLQIQRYNTVNNAFPASLADINMDTLVDPWGHPYQYLSFPD